MKTFVENYEKYPKSYTFLLMVLNSLMFIVLRGNPVKFLGTITTLFGLTGAAFFALFFLLIISRGNIIGSLVKAIFWISFALQTASIITLLWKIYAQVI